MCSESETYALNKYLYSYRYENDSTDQFGRNMHNLFQLPGKEVANDRERKANESYNSNAYPYFLRIRDKYYPRR